jgi:hypothetical protein
MSAIFLNQAFRTFKSGEPFDIDERAEPALAAFLRIEPRFKKPRSHSTQE